MSVEKNTTNQWPDPKDFGLPVVEIKPIHPIPSADFPENESLAEVPQMETVGDVAPNPETGEVEIHDMESTEVESPTLKSAEVESPNQESTEVEVPAKEPLEEVVPNQEVQSIIAERISELGQPNPQKVSSPKPIESKADPAKKESKSWIGIAAVIAFLILAVIIWQTMTGNKSVEEPIVVQIELATIDSSSEEPTSSVNDSKDEAIQDSENQSSIAESESSVDPSIQKAQTGTTIDRTVQGTLIRVDSKAARPTYFIIVGSLPNERMALEEISQYQNRVPSVYLISPYDESNNYRLAIGSFGSFTQANEELERIKADYTEALWILKY